jgi:parallel beta-helix repeat protein
MSPVLRVWFVITLCAVLFLSITPCFAQNTIHVPGDQPTIQGAIDAANNGDTVLVAPGTYYENINFSGKAITVTSSAGAAQTTIDGGQKGPVVSFTTNEGLSSVLNGFTIQNGTASSTTFYSGSGIFIYAASPTITSSVIQKNSQCAGQGVGIAAWYSSPIIRGNIVQNNITAGGCSGFPGGVVSLNYAGSAQILGNTIINNPANMYGVELYYAGNPVVENNVIAGNVAGGVYSAGTGGVIAQNVIYNNSTSNAMYFISIPAPGPVVVSNTVIGNAAQGAALYAYGVDSSAVFSNNLFIGAAGQTAVYCDPIGGSTFPVFINNDAFSNGGSGFGGTCNSQSNQNNNISADPLFVNPAAMNFRLQTTSPAIDAGTNSATNLPQTDFAGNPRILDGNNDCVSTVDMGTYELVRSANVSVSANSLTFPSQPLGTSSSPRSATLSNTGNTCFQFSNVGITGDFSQSNTCSAAGVRGGTSCSFNVTFTPTTLGTRLGALTVSGSDGITSATPSVSLSGLGADFSLGANPSSAAVKHGQSVKFTITVSPLGGAFGSPVALSCSGLPTGGSCGFSPSSLTPGDRGATSVMTVSTVGKTPRGNYNVLVVGKSGSDSHSTTVLLSVN